MDVPMREGFWIVAATGEYQLITDHALWLTTPKHARGLGLSEDVVEALKACKWDHDGPGRRQILTLAMDNGLIRSRGHGPAEVTFEFRMDTEAAIRVTLAGGTGILKTAKLHGVGTSVVQRIKNELKT